MKYEVQIRANNGDLTKYLVDTREVNDLNQAFNAADDMLKQHSDCVAEIRDGVSNEIVTTIS